MLTEAEQFFYDHAPYSYDPKAESAGQGRERMARGLAEAEGKLKAGPYFTDYEPDPARWDGDMPNDGPLWIVRLWSVKDSTDAELIGSIGSVACEEGSPYFRVVAAELALGHLA